MVALASVSDHRDFIDFPRTRASSKLEAVLLAGRIERAKVFYRPRIATEPGGTLGTGVPSISARRFSRAMLRSAA